MNAKRTWALLPIVAACGVVFLGRAVFGQDPAGDAAAAAATADSAVPFWVWIVWLVAPAGALTALFFAREFYREMMASSEGDAEMIEIAGHVREGAMAYLNRQYRVVAVVFVLLSILLSLMAFVLHVQHGLVPFAFLTGGFFSGLCGYLGMRTATNAAHRTAAGARENLNKGLVVAFRSGAVMGLVVVGFALIDICGWFILLYLFAGNMTLVDITVVMLTFGMGASTQALFARVGGGIYTKAADVGADLVGKVEAGIPEDDPRNPATIADNVGDNVGDVAGMGADLYESYAGSILSTAALGVAAAVSIFGSEQAGREAAVRLLIAPMVLAGIGIFLSILGIKIVRTREGADMGQLLSALGRGVNVSSILIAIAALGVCRLLLGSIDGVSWFGVWIAIIAGLFAGVVIGKFTEYYTSYEHKPTRDIAEQATTGPATVIIAGVAEGMKSTWAALTTIILAILCAFYFAGGAHEFTMGLYGVGISAVGMLATLGITLATDAYGPIADNAGGNAQMTEQPPHVRERTDALDSLGNTTAATGKGFAIGSAALTALALLAAYIEEVRVGQNREAEAFLVTQKPEASKSDDAGYGDLFYIGYGKLAHKHEKGTREADFRAMMILGEVPEDLKPGDKLGVLLPRWASGEAQTSSTMATNWQIRDWKYDTGKSIDLNYDEDNHTIELPAFRDTAGKEHELRIVSARKASLPQYMQFYDVTLMNPRVICGLFSGVLLVFLFCALTMKAVGRAAYRMMLECRTQFGKMREWMKRNGMSEAEIGDPQKWPKRVDLDGHRYPDYATCVAISTAGAQKEMIFPSLLAIIMPVFVGLVLGVPGVMGLLAGGLCSGFAVAIFMANAGGAWDNAKKYIETGHHGGKGSPAHKAGVVGDTVGDPFKDTSGPSLNILIKLMSMVSVVFAGLIVKFGPQIAHALGLD